MAFLLRDRRQDAEEDKHHAQEPGDERGRVAQGHAGHVSGQPEVGVEDGLQNLQRIALSSPG